MMTNKAYSDSSKAKAYDDRIKRAIPGYEMLHQRSLSVLTNYVQPGQSILVVGAGTGTECIHFAQSLSGIKITGIDPEAAMIDVATAKLAAAGVVDRVELLAGHVVDLAQTDFDAATLLLVLHFLPDDGAKLTLLKDIAARLKPGAVLVLADLFGDGWDSESQNAHDKDWRQFQLDSGIVEADVDAGFKHARKNIHPVSEHRLVELLAEAGFDASTEFFRHLCFGGWVARRV